MALEYRKLFLQEFTKSLIANSKPKRETFPYHPVKPWVVEAEFQPLMLENNQQMIPREEILEIMSSPHKSPQNQFRTFRPSFAPGRTTISGAREIVQGQSPIIESITPAPQPLPVGFSLGRINQLVSDKNVSLIECPGPGRQIIVKTMGRGASPTPIILSEQDIRKVIETFSDSAKIPLLEGMFKAAVGNLVITAVLSDFVGSRFIINKSTPYSILEKSYNSYPPMPYKHI